MQSSGLALPSNGDSTSTNDGRIISSGDAGNGPDLAGNDGSGGSLQPPDGWIAIDARELTQSKIKLGDVWLETRVITQLPLSPGSYIFEVIDGLTSDATFTVTPAGAVDYPTSIPMFYSGRGTRSLVVHGGRVTVTAAPFIMHTTLTNVLGDSLHCSRYGPTNYAITYPFICEHRISNSVDSANLYVGLDLFDDFTFDAAFDDVAAGRGFSALYLRRRNEIVERPLPRT